MSLLDRLRGRHTAPQRPPSREEIAEGWADESWKVAPELQRLAACLSALTTEGWATLRQSESDDDWPHWWGQWVDRPGGWCAFVGMCDEALRNRHLYHIPIICSLTAIEEDRATHGFSGDANERTA
jgi:hypothetical protein